MSTLPFDSKVDEVRSILNGIQSSIDHLPVEAQKQILNDFEVFASQLRDRIKDATRTGNSLPDSQTNESIKEKLYEIEERERTKEAEMQALMDAVPALIWISRDPECKEMVGNRYGYEFLDMWKGANISKTAPEEDLAQQPYRNFKNGREIPNNELPMQVAASTGVGASNYEFDLVFKNGEVRNVLGNVVPLFNPSGEPSGAVAAFVDITERRRMEADQQKNLTQVATQRHLLQARENERVQIARDIHDGPLQTLVAMILDIEFFKEGIKDQAIKTEFETLGASLRSAVQELRQVISELRPPVSVEFGLVNAIRDYTVEICEKSSIIGLDLVLDEGIRDLSEDINITIYRICQEALQNITRHAEASQVFIKLAAEDGQILLEIKDNGVGFSVSNDFADLTANKHYGLAGMTERAEAAGGNVQIFSKPGKGTEIKVSVPYEQD